MTSDRREVTDKLIRALDATRFEEFQAGLRHSKEVADHDAKLLKARDKRRAALLAAAGIDAKKLEATQQKQGREEEPLLKELRDGVRKRYVNRPSKRAADAKEQALRAAVLAEAGLTSVPIFGASMFVADVAPFQKSPFWNLLATEGSIEPASGWYLPTDPSLLRSHLTTGGDGIDKQIDIYASYTFVPDETGTYDLTVGFSFHGWYYVRSIDSWWTLGLARVQMDLGIVVHQYVNDPGWLSNFFERSTRQSSDTGVYGLIDQTTAFSMTTQLKAGDPVVVTVQIRLKAFADGDDASFAEINFEDGAANYIQPGALVARRVS